MTVRSKALIAWSSGKDSAWALHEARRAGDFDIVGALTTVTDTFGRVSMHGVREQLLRAQLDAAGLLPIIVHIPFPCSNEIYEQKMAEAIGNARASGVTRMIFGDLFLEDVRAYRERHFAGTGITPVFPVWGGRLRPSRVDAAEAHLSTVDLAVCLPRSLAGDGALLDTLPAAPTRAARTAVSFVSAGRCSRAGWRSGWRNRRARWVYCCRVCRTSRAIHRFVCHFGDDRRKASISASVGVFSRGWMMRNCVISSGFDSLPS